MLGSQQGSRTGRLGPAAMPRSGPLPRPLWFGSARSVSLWLLQTLLADQHRRSPQLSYSLLPAAGMPARAPHVPVLVPSTCVVVRMVLS